MKYFVYSAVFLMGFLLTSCFEEDEAVLPYTPPPGVTSVQLEQSIYTHHIFYDFSEDEITSSYPNQAWQIAFEASADGWHVLINSSDYWGAKKTGLSSVNENFIDDPTNAWAFDNANGNLDSTAIGEWVSITATDTLVAADVYVLGQYNGIEYVPAYLLQFTGFSDDEYMFLFRDLNESQLNSVVVQKAPAYNFVYYSLKTREILYLEPPKESWDIEFAQYATILFDNQGIPTPYFVRGVLLNPKGVSAMVDSSGSFFDWTLVDAYSGVYSSTKDFIGHEWKDVEINEGSNTATYEVNRSIIYSIRDAENNYYKLRFRGYHNNLGQKGYPSFEYSKLNE